MFALFRAGPSKKSKKWEKQTTRSSAKDLKMHGYRKKVLGSIA
jgi:hypothetical protein